MFKNLLIKWKLATLVAIMLLALAFMGYAGFSGLRGATEDIVEIGTNRLPSVEGLLTVSEGQTAVKSATLATAIYENDYAAQKEFLGILELRKKAWANIQSGWKIYEPLPQTKEEGVLWKKFEADWADWKRADDQLGAVITSLSANQAEKTQKALFTDFYKQFLESRPLFNKAEASLNKVVELNVTLGHQTVKDSIKESANAMRTLFITGLLAVLISVALAVFITLSVTRPLSVAVETANLLAEGDLRVRINATSKDETGQVLQAMSNMITKLSQVVTDV
ncbi:MAG: MCP four helix bundle domain-containing protein, partial [Rhodoferax sp.]